jgi:hypothetical protein
MRKSGVAYAMRADDDILRTILSCVEDGRYRADDVMGFIFEGIDNARP